MRNDNGWQNEFHLTQSYMGINWIACRKYANNNQMDLQGEEKLHEQRLSWWLKCLNRRKVWISKSFSSSDKVEDNKKCDNYFYMFWLENFTNGCIVLKEVYIKQLEGFINSQFEHLVFKLNKLFYGICQVFWA
jgi:hypothetical protein